MIFLARLRGRDWLLITPSIEPDAEAAIDQALDVSRISPIQFPLLALLAKRLDDISEECHNGRGFCVVRGIEPAEYTDEENVILYAGIPSYIVSERAFLDRARQKVLCTYAFAFEGRKVLIICRAMSYQLLSSKTEISRPGLRMMQWSVASIHLSLKIGFI